MSGIPSRDWQGDAKAQLQQLKAEGLTITAICLVMKCSRNTLKSHHPHIMKGFPTGRRSVRYTLEQRRTVNELAKLSIEDREIATVIDVTLEALRKNFEQEIRIGRIHLQVSTLTEINRQASLGNVEAMTTLLTKFGGATWKRRRPPLSLAQQRPRDEVTGRYDRSLHSVMRKLDAEGQAELQRAVDGIQVRSREREFVHEPSLAEDEAHGALPAERFEILTFEPEIEPRPAKKLKGPVFGIPVAPKIVKGD